MAENKKASARVRPIIHAYIDDLVKTGAYGKGKAGVVRRLIENGIAGAIAARALEKKDIRDFGETLDEDDDED